MSLLSKLENELHTATNDLEGLADVIRGVAHDLENLQELFEEFAHEVGKFYYLYNDIYDDLTVDEAIEVVDLAMKMYKNIVNLGD